jgi:hypothetical protein
VAKSDKVKFLGFTVVNGTIAIAHKALQTAMDKVKALTPRGTHHTLETTLDEINHTDAFSSFVDPLFLILIVA